MITQKAAIALEPLTMHPDIMNICNIHINILCMYVRMEESGVQYETCDTMYSERLRVRDWGGSVSINTLIAVMLNFCDTNNTENRLRNGRDMHEVVCHAEREQINAALFLC